MYTDFPLPDKHIGFLFFKHIEIWFYVYKARERQREFYLQNIHIILIAQIWSIHTRNKLDGIKVAPLWRKNDFEIAAKGIKIERNSFV